VVVADIPSASLDPDVTARLANATLQNVRSRFSRIEDDSGVRSAFTYLLALAARARSPEGPLDVPVPDLRDNPAPARLAAAMAAWVDQARGSPEHAEIAKQAAADVIADWSAQSSSQQEFFEREGLQPRWLKAAEGAGFSEVARRFFASFTERYLSYFLDREASASVDSVSGRQAFARNLHQRVDDVSRYAFDTSKITQSFAAGWYNKHARRELPNARQVRSFLRLAFQKVREELARESARS
jgi:hypothetical protein